MEFLRVLIIHYIYFQLYRGQDGDEPLVVAQQQVRCSKPSCLSWNIPNVPVQMAV